MGNLQVVLKRELEEGRTCLARLEYGDSEIVFKHKDGHSEPP
jgi:hypothetical protein